MYDRNDNGLKLSNSWAGYCVILNPEYKAQVWKFCLLMMSHYYPPLRTFSWQISSETYKKGFSFSPHHFTLFTDFQCEKQRFVVLQMLCVHMGRFSVCSFGQYCKALSFKTTYILRELTTTIVEGFWIYWIFKPQKHRVHQKTLPICISFHFHLWWIW